MKAKIIRQKMHESITDWAHGGGHTIKRLLVEERDNLAITPHDNQVHALTNFDLGHEYEVIGEVEVSNELIEKALTFVRAKEEFYGLKGVFEALLG